MVSYSHYSAEAVGTQPDLSDIGTDIQPSDSPNRCVKKKLKQKYKKVRKKTGKIKKRKVKRKMRGTAFRFACQRPVLKQGSKNIFRSIKVPLKKLVRDQSTIDILEHQ